MKVIFCFCRWRLILSDQIFHQVFSLCFLPWLNIAKGEAAANLQKHVNFLKCKFCASHILKCLIQPVFPVSEQTFLISKWKEFMPEAIVQNQQPLLSVHTKITNCLLKANLMSHTLAKSVFVDQEYSQSMDWILHRFRLARSQPLQRIQSVLWNKFPVSRTLLQSRPWL